MQRQLELYNARDLEPFMQLFTDDVYVSDGITGAVIASSKEQLRPRYVSLAKLQPGAHGLTLRADSAMALCTIAAMRVADPLGMWSASVLAL